MSTVAPAAPATSAAPAPAAAPAPSSPTPVAEPGGSGAGDPLEQLRNETIAWGHEGDQPAAPAEGNPPAAPEQTAAEGSPPPTEGQPAPTDAPTESAFEYWKTRYGGDQEKAAKEALALEQRAVDMARRLKELETAQPSATTPAAPVAAAAAQPTPAQVPPATPAQPAQPEGQPASIEDQALQHALTKDPQCRDFVAKHNTNLTRLEELNKTEIPGLQEQIRAANLLIAHPGVDEMVKDEQRNILQRAELTLAAREATASKLVLDNQILDGNFRSRVGDFVSHLETQAAATSREAVADQDAVRQADDFVGHWPNAFEQEFKLQAIDPEMRAEIHEAVKVLALARPNRIDLKDLPAFMKDSIKAEFNKVDKYHRIQARAHALRKNADVNPAAPTGPAATASPAPESVTTEDQLNALRNETRQAFRARRSA